MGALDTSYFTSSSSSSDRLKNSPQYSVFSPSTVRRYMKYIVYDVDNDDLSYSIYTNICMIYASSRFPNYLCSLVRNDSVVLMQLVWTELYDDNDTSLISFLLLYYPYNLI
eukprot:203375_1